MTTESDALREALFAQMSAPPLPEYSGDTVVLRGRKMANYLPRSPIGPAKIEKPRPIVPKVGALYAA